MMQMHAQRPEGRFGHAAAHARVALSIYRIALRLSPSTFRREFGGEMVAGFSALYAEAMRRGFLATVGFVIEAAIDAIRTAAVERRGGARVGGQAGSPGNQTGSRFVPSRGAFMRDVLGDIRYAFRAAVRQRGAVLVCILVLGLGIGASTAIFSVIQAVVLRPLPYGAPDDLAMLWNRWKGSPTASLSNPEFLDYSERTRSLKMAAFTGDAVNLVDQGEPERLRAGVVSYGIFDLLRVQPVLGRGFVAEEQIEGRHHVTVLSDPLWRRRFDANPNVIGRSILLDGVPHIVVGVMGADFALPLDFDAEERPALWVPLPLDVSASRTYRGGHYLSAVARLEPGHTLAEASTELRTLAATMVREYPDAGPHRDPEAFGIILVPLAQQVFGDSMPAMIVLAAAVAFVLLIACANVANLQLARADARQRELAVRAALGARGFRILRLVLIDSLVIATIGGVVGVLFASVALQAILRLGGAELPRIHDARVDPVTLAFAVGAAAFAALASALLPALQAFTPHLQHSLQDSSRGSTGSGRVRVRRVLVAAQLALSLVLLTGAALMIKSFVRLSAVDKGFSPDQLLSLRLSVPESTYPEAPQIVSFFDRFLNDIRALPGVASAGAVTGLPLAASRGDWDFDIEGRGADSGEQRFRADWQIVTAGYFQAMGIPLRRGRFPGAGDTMDAPGVVFINESMAAAFWPDADPIGQRIKLKVIQPKWLTVAGIVGNVRQDGLDALTVPEYYLPHPQWIGSPNAARALTIVCRSRQEPDALAGSIRALLARLDPTLPVAAVRTMDEVVDRSMATRRLNMLLLAAFAMVAVILAAAGTYAVMAYSVGRRAREIGVRMALGARPADVLRLVLSEAAGFSALGLVAGLLGAVAATRLIATLLFDVKATDPAAFAAVTALLLAVSLLAAYIPARRATRVDPVTVLRAE